MKYIAHFASINFSVYSINQIKWTDYNTAKNWYKFPNPKKMLSFIEFLLLISARSSQNAWEKFFNKQDHEKRLNLCVYFFLYQTMAFPSSDVK